MTTLSRRKALALIGTAGLATALTPTFTFASNNTIVCNWNKNFPPYSMESNGTMTGILVECVQELVGNRMGYTVEHRGYTWPQAQDLVRANKGDTLCTNPTTARKQYVDFAEEPLIESMPSLFCAVDNPRFSEINSIIGVGELKKFKQVDYTGNGWARKTFPPSLRITYLESLPQVIQAIASGKADIFVGNGLAAMYVIKELGLKNKIHARELPVGEPSSFHFGVRRDFPGVKSFMEKYEEIQETAQIENVTRSIIMHYL